MEASGTQEQSWYSRAVALQSGRTPQQHQAETGNPFTYGEFRKVGILFCGLHNEDDRVVFLGSKLGFPYLWKLPYGGGEF